jgi:hypothetical protein
VDWPSARISVYISVFQFVSVFAIGPASCRAFRFRLRHHTKKPAGAFTSAGHQVSLLGAAVLDTHPSTADFQYQQTIDFELLPPLAAVYASIKHYRFFLRFARRRSELPRATFPPARPTSLAAALQTSRHSSLRSDPAIRQAAGSYGSKPHPLASKLLCSAVGAEGQIPPRQLAFWAL